jgi:hypothetical protein
MPQKRGQNNKIPNAREIDEQPPHELLPRPADAGRQFTRKHNPVGPPGKVKIG